MSIISDYASVVIQYNTGTNAASVYTGTAVQFGGSAGANEFRWQRTGGGAIVSTPSAAWSNIIKPGSVAAVEEMWAFTTDTAGSKINYDGTIGNPQQFRLSFSADGSPASAMQITAFQDAINTTPVPGTQISNATTGCNIINGHATDTSSTSYWKMNMFGSGYPSGGAQETPATSGNAGTTCTATTGTNGSLSPGAAAWMSTWQSAQGWLQYITAPSVAKVLQAFYWYGSSIMYVGPNLGTGIMVLSPFVLQYSYT